MSPNSPNSRERGFTLIEMVVSMAVLVVVLILSLMLLFSMRSFADRQQLIAQPRQVARRGLDYVTYLLRAAGDFNQSRHTIIPYMMLNNVMTPATVDNCQNANQADVGTDLISFIVPRMDVMIPVSLWVGQQHAANAHFYYVKGCPDDAAMMANFEQEVQWHQCEDGQWRSAVLQIWDVTGQWVWYQITDISQPSGCDPALYPDQIKCVANSGLSEGVNPPGGSPQLNCAWPNAPCSMQSLNFMALRVRNRTLEQKTGAFYPTTDNPGSAFFTLLDNVEDMQIAYIYDDGRVYNTASLALPTQNNIPTTCSQFQTDTSICQTWLGGQEQFNPQHLLGLRISITARAPRPMPDTVVGQYWPTQIENHNPGARPTSPSNEQRIDMRTYRYRLTSTVMLRNRVKGG